MKFPILLTTLPLAHCSAFVVPAPAVGIMNNYSRRLEFSSRRPSSSINSLSHFVFKKNSFPKRQRHTAAAAAAAAAAAGAATQNTLRRRRGRSPITALGASGLVAVAVSASSAVAIVVVGLVGVSIVSVVEGGVRGDLGASQEDILGVPAEDATAADVARLGKAGFMQLFYASPCPAEGDLDGEYLARTLDIGVLHRIASVITHRIWGPGRWLGKAFRMGSSEGYNLFSTSRTPPSSGSSDAEGLLSAGDTRRERRFRFSIFSGSVFDRGESSTLDYGGKNGNGPLFGGMRDEIRKVNGRLFVGLGYIQAFGGKYNTAPFVVEGPAISNFCGPDSAS